MMNGSSLASSTATTASSCSSYSAGRNGVNSSSHDTILPGRLHLGDKNAASDSLLLTRLGVTHVLTCELIPLQRLVTSKMPNLAVMHVQVSLSLFRV